MKPGPKARDKAVRFAQKVQRRGEADCWEYVGSRNPAGYGKFFWDGQRKLVKAHRAAIAFAGNGELPPDDRIVMHLCDNPPCCNPSHLRVGTLRDNTRDMLRKGRHHTSGALGRANVNAKLTEDAVREIRATPVGYGWRKRLSEKFGVSGDAIRSVKVGRCWKHVS